MKRKWRYKAAFRGAQWHRETRWMACPDKAWERLKTMADEAGIDIGAKPGADTDDIILPLFHAPVGSRKIVAGRKCGNVVIVKLPHDHLQLVWENEMGG
jgi:hypothetical protein